METVQYLKIICEEIHSVVVATLDREGHPVTRVIDMMLHDDSSLYFLTAKGKEFYRQLMDQKYLSLSGMSGGEGSMSKKAVSVHGNVRNITLTCPRSPSQEELFPWVRRSRYRVATILPTGAGAVRSVIPNVRRNALI